MLSKETTMAPDHVWVITRWIFGGGGDDDRKIIGVFTTAEKAYAQAMPDDEVMAYPLDPASTR